MKWLKVILDEKNRGAVVEILEILHDALQDGVQEYEAVEALNKIAKVVVDLILPGKDVKVNVK